MEKSDRRSKRKKINWFKVMLSLKNADIEHAFILLSARLYRGRGLSRNRCAYYALKTYYSTTSIDDLLRKINL